ncbi:hypothetical protein KR222_001115, partial [Zaprionus bogoriensis]
KVNISASAICSKCTCDTRDSLLDCSEKLDAWFSPEEWQILQNGDVIFETLKLSHNNLTNITVLPTYGAKNLYLDHNQIDSIAKGAFANWTELTQLDLSHNKLTSKALLPDVFKGPYSAQDFEPLKNLKSLNLGYNLLHSLNDDLFEHVPHLEELILCSNTFHVIDKLSETAISGLTSLKSLDISSMEIDSLPDTIFHGPSELDTLIASGNLFTEVPEALSRAKNLHRLVLDDNPINNLEGENVFPSIPNLKYLSMSFMLEIYSIGAGAFSELQNLTEVILSDNKRLEVIDEFAFSKNVTGGMYLDYPPLEKLYLNNCNLTFVHEHLIVRWDKLSELDLRCNPWSCDATNEYMIEYLIKQVNKTLPALANNVRCAYPENLKDVEVLKVASDNLMETSHGSLLWITLLVCVLLLIPLTLVGIVVYRRDACGWRRKNEAARRALYSRTSFNEDFHI